MSHKPTLVFVHGSWHNTACWDKIIPLLETHQYKCIRVALPSTASDPSATFSQDLEAAREAILSQTTQNHDVIVVVHSYGGVVGSSAIKGFAQSKQTSATLPAKETSGHVVGLIMLASGFMPTGLSFLDALGGQPPPSWKADSESGFAVITVDPRELFYHDLPTQEGELWVSRLEKQSLKALKEGGEDVYAGWMDVPVWYLATKEDKAVPIDAQRMFVQMAKDAGGDVTLREVDSSHSPMLSRPKETVDFILEAVAAFEQK